MFRLAVLLFASIATCPSRALAEACGQWDVNGAIAGIDGQVLAMARWDPDGEGPAPEVLVVGGEFGQAGSARALNIAYWTGNKWLPLGEGLDGAVRSLAVVGGALVAGGDFGFSGANPVRHIARWFGGAWQPLGMGVDNSVYALCEHDGALIAGGVFTTAGTSLPVNRVAAWTGSTWSAMGDGFNSTVATLASYNGELVAGGYFDGSGSNPLGHIARWSGSEWMDLEGGGVDDYVYALLVHDGHLYVGGIFQNAGPIAAGYIALYDGGWGAIGQGNELDGAVTSLSARGLDVIAGGYFSSRLTRINLYDGSGFTPYVGAPNGAINDVEVFGGQIHVGGQFAIVGSYHDYLNIALLHDSGAWRPVADIFDAPLAAALVYQDELVVSGRFLYGHGESMRGISAFDGAGWRTLGGGVTFEHYNYTDPPVLALAEFNGDLVIGGFFSHAGGVPADNIATWDGQTWAALGRINGVVLALCVHNGQLVAAGTFDVVNENTPAQNIAVWNGAAWEPLGSGLYGDQFNQDVVYSVASYGGQLVAGGRFDLAGGSAIRSLASWDGNTWHSLGDGITNDIYGLAPIVFALEPFEGELYVGGTLGGLASGLSIRNVARWNGFSVERVGEGVDGAVYSFATYAGELIVGGSFGAAGIPPGKIGVGAGNVARWNGQRWAQLDNYGVVGGSVYGMATFQGEVVAVGDFVSAGWLPSHYISSWRHRGDVDANGIVDFHDLNVLLDMWGEFATPGALPADLNDDGMVGFDDLNEVLSFFNTDC